MSDGTTERTSPTDTQPDDLRSWRVAGLIALAVIVLSVPVHLMKEGRSRTVPVTLETGATFVGSDACADCHEEEYEAWIGSDHDRATELASDRTVLGDFNDAEFADGDVFARFYNRAGRYFVYTHGPDGELAEFEITHTLGFNPLQQYLVPFSGGRLQALTIAWDTERGVWFDMIPDRAIDSNDWMHWTRGGQNWNSMCAECHSTNLAKGYNALTREYATTWSEIDVGCESCHGPSSLHVAWAEVTPMARLRSENYELVINTSEIGPAQEVEMCAPCHSHHVDFDRHDHTQTELMQEGVPSLLREDLYFPDGQIIGDVYDYGSFQQSKMYRKGVRCGDCHDVHDLELTADGNDLCLPCHQASIYDSYDHHFHEERVDGALNEGRLCVKCHMPERSFMIVDRRADHSIHVPRPDLTIELGVPNACASAGCHDGESDRWNADYFRQWYGEHARSHFGTTLAAGREGRPEAHEGLIEIAGDTLYAGVVRATALSLLSSYSGARNAEAFKLALADEDPLVRYTAAEFANSLTLAELVEAMTPLLFDPVKAVRLQAALRLAGTPAGMLQDYQRAQLDESLREFRDAMTHSLEFPFAEYNLGTLHLAERDTAGAEEHFRAAIELDERYFPAKLNLAQLLWSSAQYEEAERLLREVVSDAPELGEAYYSLGLLLAEMERYAEAESFLRRAAEAMPGRSRVYLNLGLVEQAAGQTALAEAALRRALEMEPGNLDYQFALADHFVRRGEFGRALEVAERMVNSHPGSEVGFQVKIYIEEIMQKSADGVVGYGSYDLRGISDYYIRVGGASR